jgi:hypothetical protein
LVFGTRAADTLPYIVEPGAIAAIRDDDVLGTPIQSKAIVATYDLSDDRQRDDYARLVNAAYTGWYKIIVTERRWDDVAKKMYVYVEAIIRNRYIAKEDEYNMTMDKMQGVNWGMVR